MAAGIPVKVKTNRTSRRRLIQAGQAFHSPVKKPRQTKIIADKDASEYNGPGRSLEASETRYRRLFETAKDGILILNAETGVVIDVNPFLIMMLGFNREEICGKQLWELGFFKDIAANKGHFKELKKNKFIRYEDLPLETADGRKFYVEFVSNVYQEGSQRVIQCNIRDITERKLISLALQANEKKYNELFNQSPDGIFSIELSGKIVTFNKAISQGLGYSEEEFQSMNIRDIIPEQYLDQHIKILTNILEGKSLEEAAEYALRGKDGKLHFVEVISAPQYLGKEIIGFQGIARDITARKQAEKGLADSELRFRALIENNSDAIALISPDGKIIYRSPAAYTLLGLDPAKPRSDSMLGAVHPEDVKEVMKSFGQILQTPRLSLPFKYRVQHSNGSWRWVEGIGMNLLAETGVNAIVTNYRDVTERKRSESEHQSLLEIMQGVATTNSLNDLLELIRQSLSKVIYAENFFVVFHNNKSGLFEEVFAVDKFDPPMAPSRLEKSIVSYIFRTGQPLLLSQAKFEELERQGEVELVGTKPAVWMGAPLKTPTGTIGVMAVQNYEDSNCFSERDLEFLSSVSAQVSVAIERKQVEEAHRMSEEKYRTLVDEVNDGFYVTDEAGVFTLANPALARIYGVENPEVLIGRMFSDFLSPERPAGINEAYNSAMQTGSAPAIIKGQVVRPDGTIAFIEVKPSMIVKNGRIAGTRGVVRDITERKLAEETLQKSENRFRALVDNSLEEISLLAADGTLTWESPNTRRPLGYPPNSFVGHSLLEIFHPDEREAATRLLGRIQEKPGNMEEAVFRLRHQDGSWRWMEAVINNLLDEPAVKSIVINYRDITERKQKEEEIISRTEELTRLYQLSRDLVDANEVENVIEIVNRHAVENIHTTFACIELIEDDNLVLRGIYPVRKIEYFLNLGDRFPITSLPVCKRVLEGLEPVILKKGDPEVGEAERSTLMLDFAQSVCLVPLHLGDPKQHLNQTIGLLILGEAREEKREPFTPEKIRLARSIGDQAAAAIRRLMLREQAGRRLRQLVSLSEIDRMIASTFDLRVSLQIILKQVLDQLKVDSADVLVLNKYTQMLEYTAGSGFLSHQVESTRQPLGEGQAGRALFERKLIKITDIAKSGAVFSHPELIKAELAAAYFAMPLITKGQVMGVLEILHRTPLDPDEEWLDFFKTLAGQAAIAIDNVQMFERLQKSTDELELAYDATIEGWSRALDLRDKETEGHTQRVTGITVELARSFGLSEPDLVKVRWGALLHDIGKMGVPDSILLKPGSLTDEEWVVMKRHPKLAYEMLLPIRYLHGALDIPYCHHEWWDGSGYPRGLKGEEIPLAARIFAVVDVWDALISDRPYRPAWTKEKALAHIQAEAGTHFDPQVVIEFNAGHGKTGFTPR